ncbi:hypothetical protein LZ554_006384 [Drepanopeziza brunnea f. sp. 'monogermtubi']|nr:hypothetical protein LZ554_006384 [Drepanopeziza brunnea f. sp. 'monogermtubi']
MPASLRTIDADSQRYDVTDDDGPFHDRRRVSSGSVIRLTPSPAESDTNNRAMRHASPRGSPLSATTREERRITRHLERGAPGDEVFLSDPKTPERKQLAQKKSQYFEEVFACRPNSSARERVTKESMIVADVRTNVIIHDEYSFITDLSYYLSNRYQRPENSIVVSLIHSHCMLFGGNFDPAYNLTITALPCQLQPVTNKRNAALLAAHMDESLGVGPRRGVIKFVATAEENLANDGKTVAGEIEDLEKETTDSYASVQRSLSRGTSKSRKRHSMRMGPLPTHEESILSTSTYSSNETPPLPSIPAEKRESDVKAEKVRKMSRRKSFIATMFGKA